MSSTAQAISFDRPFVAAERIGRGKVPSPPPAPRKIHEPIRLLQGLTILMVVYLHSVIPGHHYSGTPEIIGRFVRACAVPFFIAISGFLYSRTRRLSKPYTDVMKEKAYRLLLPYFVLSSIAFSIKALFGHLAARPIELTWRAYAHQLLFPWDNAIIFFWFLPTLFLIFAISIPLDKWIVGGAPIRLAGLLLGLFALSALAGIRDLSYPVRLLNICGVLNYLFNFWLGYTVCRYETLVLTVLGRKWRALLLLAFVVTLAIATPDANHAIATIEGSCGFLALFALTSVVSKNNFWQRSLSRIGDESYQIYLLSWFFQTMPIILFSQFVSKDQSVCLLISFLLAVSGPLCIAYLVGQRIPAARPLIGLR